VNTSNSATAHDGKAKNFDFLRECIRQYALKNGMSPNDAVCHALAIGLKELENGQTLTLSEDLEDMSARQRAVLEALRKGMAVKEIAGSLNISEATVRTHILRIRTRLDCPDLLKLRIQ
jgi:DNA-binding NarL/FixJ family response regulator